MNDSNGYAVFFFPQALEALGEAIKPYLQDGPMGQHVLCTEIDTGGALLEMTIEGQTSDGRTVMLDLMVPGSMVRMIVSSQSDAMFGFGPRVPLVPVTALPAVGPTALPADAPPGAVPTADAVPDAAAASPAAATTDSDAAAKPAP